MKIVIIGGVAAGMSAASKIVRMDKNAEITVYEKGGFLSYGACGLPYYVGDFNDDYRKMIARTKEKFTEMGIATFLHHEVLRVDSDSKTVTIKNLQTGQSFVDQYDKLMIATGASAVVPPIEGKEMMGIHVLKTMEDGIFLREYAKNPSIQNVVIVGGGYIGVECAEAFLHLGKKVRVIEATDHILAPFDLEISELVKKELIENGVELHLTENVTKFLGNFSVEKVETNRGVYQADLVIIAVGIRPNTSFLSDTKMERSQNGAILVDRKLQTSIPDIYAAGDCILVPDNSMNENTYLALGTVANKCGRIAGKNMAGGDESFIGALGSAAIKVCNLELARTGVSEKDAKRLGMNYKTVVVAAYDHPAYYPNPTPITFKIIYDKVSKKILGAQACGIKGAVLRIDVFAVAIQAGMTVEELGMTDLVYAPPFAGVWDAIQIACNAAK